MMRVPLGLSIACGPLRTARSCGRMLSSPLTLWAGGAEVVGCCEQPFLESLWPRL